MRRCHPTPRRFHPRASRLRRPPPPGGASATPLPSRPPGGSSHSPSSLPNPPVRCLGFPPRRPRWPATARRDHDYGADGGRPRRRVAMGPRLVVRRPAARVGVSARACPSRRRWRRWLTRGALRCWAGLAVARCGGSLRPRQGHAAHLCMCFFFPLALVPLFFPYRCTPLPFPSTTPSLPCCLPAFLPLRPLPRVWLLPAGPASVSGTPSHS